MATPWLHKLKKVVRLRLPMQFGKNLAHLLRIRRMDKTTQNDSSVKDYIASLDEQTAKDAQVLTQMMQRISGQTPKLWNAGTIGFDTYHYEYASGREGDGHV